MFIYYFKTLMSISDIQSILNPLTDRFFGGSGSISLEHIYKEIYQGERDRLPQITKDIISMFKKAENSFSDVSDEEEKKYLQTFSFICYLCFDMYIKKEMVENIIDEFNSGKKLSANEMQYLRMNDPVTYAKMAKVQIQRKALESRLKQAKSKEEALEIYTSAKSRISDDDPAREELNAAYDDAYGEFKKSEQYKKLPATEKEAKEKEKNGTSRSSWNKDITGDTKFTENEEETYEFGISGDFEGEE